MSMSTLCVSLVLMVTIQAVLSNEEGGGLARGWGDSIAWRTLEEGKVLAAQENKPLMLVIHKSWCGACKALKPIFSGSNEIADLSEKFVMVNALDDEEPQEPGFAPDGGYIPRILFLSPEGEVQPEHSNVEGSSEYKYFYALERHIVKSMNRVLGEGTNDDKIEL